MAQKVNIVLVDDIDGKPIEDGGTVAFGLDGTNYEIDLSDKHAAALRSALSKYVAVARRVGKVNGAKRSGVTTKPTGPSAKDVREWATANGHEVPERGRIPADVREAYDAAH